MRRHRLRTPLPLIVISLLALGILLSAIRQHGYLQFLELATYDLLVANIANGPSAPTTVSMILVGEEDIQRLGSWPLTDAQLHDILERILDLDPRVVGVDIYRDLEVPPGREQLRDLLRDNPRIIAIEKFPGVDSPGIPPPPVLQGSDRVGFSDLLSDPGGVVRRNLLFLSDDTRTGYSLSLQLALGYLQAHGIYPAGDESNPSYLRLGDVTFVPLEGNEGGYVDADPGGYQIVLGYRDAARPFPVFSLQQLLRGDIGAEQIKDRIVILGVAAASVKDEFLSPFAIVDQANGTIAGSVIHAHATQQLIDTAMGRRQPLRWWDTASELAYLGLWIGLGFVAGWFAGPSWRFALIMISGASLIVAVAAASFAAGWWIPAIPGLLGWVFAATISSSLLAAHRRQDQLALMSLFARHVSPEVADAIWQRREEVLDDGRIRPRTLTVTTLFTDLQGFTEVSEQMEPEPFLKWLNSYMARLTDVIMQHGGVLDDYAGDGIKASFGVPFCDESHIAQHAVQAVHCAIALNLVLTELNRQWMETGHTCMAMRVGIHTGPVVVGTLGSASRMKYTTVGRNVNLASRLECLKDYPCPDADDECNNCRILISEDTRALVAGTFDILDVGEFDLKGILEKVRVFAIIGTKPKEQDDASIEPLQPADHGVADRRHADGRRG